MNETRIIPLSLSEKSLLRGTNVPWPSWGDGGMALHGVADVITLVKALCAMRVLVQDPCVVDGLMLKVEEAYEDH